MAPGRCQALRERSEWAVCDRMRWKQRHRNESAGYGQRGVGHLRQLMLRECLSKPESHCEPLWIDLDERGVEQQHLPGTIHRKRTSQLAQSAGYSAGFKFGRFKHATQWTSDLYERKWG